MDMAENPIIRARDADPSVPRLGLRPREACAALGISERKLSELISQKAIPYVRIGRMVILPVASLQQWLRDQVVTE